MTRRSPARPLACGALALAGLLGASASGAASSGVGSGVPESAAARLAAVTRTGIGPRAACPRPRPGHLTCFVLVEPNAAARRALAAGRPTEPAGWTPRQLERAYRLPAGRRTHQTIAVSIAFHTPHLASYLATYRKTFGLPPCTQAAGCLRIVDQQGHAKVTAPPGVNTGWDLEATLDVSMISAACPHCKILVVEANTTSSRDLAASEDTAARLGAQVISNSYGGPESGLTQTFARSYRHPGHMIVAASGDLGFDTASFPSNLATVTAVGGTMLSRAHNARGFTEQVWNQPDILGASTSACSAYVAKPSWQHDPHCPGRTIADTSAAAANIPIYEKSYGGWITVAGTSAAAPLTAGIYGLAGNASRRSVRYLYRHRRDFFDITRGDNVIGVTPQQACGNDYLCTAKRGYDGPTGLGTPDGLGAF